MNRYQALFSICTIAVGFYASSANAGGHNPSFNHNFNHKKQFNNQQFVHPFFIPPKKFTGSNFQGNSFHQLGHNFIPPHQFNGFSNVTNQGFNFGPKHKPNNPFFIPNFSTQGFGAGNHKFHKHHHNFNH